MPSRARGEHRHRSLLRPVLATPGGAGDGHPDSVTPEPTRAPWDPGRSRGAPRARRGCRAPGRSDGGARAEARGARGAGKPPPPGARGPGGRRPSGRRSGRRRGGGGGGGVSRSCAGVACTLLISQCWERCYGASQTRGSSSLARGGGKEGEEEEEASRRPPQLQTRGQRRRRSGSRRSHPGRRRPPRGCCESSRGLRARGAPQPCPAAAAESGRGAPLLPGRCSRRVPGLPGAPARPGPRARAAAAVPAGARGRRRRGRWTRRPRWAAASRM